jgi:hypothetical protein
LFRSPLSQQEIASLLDELGAADRASLSRCVAHVDLHARALTHIRAARGAETSQHIGAWVADGSSSKGSGFVPDVAMTFAAKAAYAAYKSRAEFASWASSNGVTDHKFISGEDFADADTVPPAAAVYYASTLTQCAVPCSAVRDSRTGPADAAVATGGTEGSQGQPHISQLRVPSRQGVDGYVGKFSNSAGSGILVAFRGAAEPPASACAQHGRRARRARRGACRSVADAASVGDVCVSILVRADAVGACRDGDGR